MAPDPKLVVNFHNLEDITLPVDIQKTFDYPVAGEELLQLDVYWLVQAPLL